ncbi:BZIP-type transcription factor [Xylariomycetidae sp. FL2044]|nr:BZIP-type transcription factor [Xylariomycetidae sp. FL2044]
MAKMADMNPAANYPSPPTHYSPSDHKPSLGSLYEHVSMSTSSSPHSQGAHGGGSNDKGPLSSLNLNFLKSLNDKKTTRDGNPPKRRGPKPDSKPALTRRQELNRQAQRTHRERKELYIKALEDEVLRLKEVFTNVSQDKDKLAEENKQLKSLLHQNGISPASAGGMDDMISNPSLGYASSGSVSGGYGPGSNRTAYTPPMTSISSAPSLSNASSHMLGGGHQQSRSLSQQQQQQPPQSRVDYDQAGIDFVLTLEKPCMDHLPWLLERASETGGEACGHALMASCPPEPFPELNNEIPFGYAHGTQHQHQHHNQHHHHNDNSNNNRMMMDAAGPPMGGGHRTWELSKGDLATLLDLSKKLDLDGEITPVMAWGMILGHPRLTELRREDFEKLIDDLKGKVRCYGYVFSLLISPPPPPPHKCFSIIIPPTG